MRPTEKERDVTRKNGRQRNKKERAGDQTRENGRQNEKQQDQTRKIATVRQRMKRSENVRDKMRRSETNTINDRTEQERKQNATE